MKKPLELIPNEFADCLFAMLSFDILSTSDAVLDNYTLTYGEIHQFGLNKFFKAENLGFDRREDSFYIKQALRNFLDILPTVVKGLKISCIC